MRDAFASRHMGRVLQADRAHPFHGPRGLSQERAAEWPGISQAQLSRIENGSPLRDLDRLIQWAQILGIPQQYLWFNSLAAGQNAHSAEATRLPLIAPDCLGAVLESGEVVVLADTVAGRINFVKVPRRVFVTGMGVSAVRVASGAKEQVLERFELASETSVLHEPPDTPVHHFRQIKQLLMEGDNLFGPHSVLHSTQEQIAAIQHLRQFRRGADEQNLLQVQTQFADLCGWLYQDAGYYTTAGQWLSKALDWSHMSTELLRLDRALARWEKTPAVSDYRAALNETFPVLHVPSGGQR